jgi:prolyl oligopeptidase
MNQGSKQVIESVLMSTSEVADRLAHFEDLGSPDTRSWSSRQNVRTRKVLRSFSEYRFVKKFITDASGFETISAPVVCGSRLFYSLFDDTAQIRRVVFRDEPYGAANVLIDVGSLQRSQGRLITSWFPSPDGSRLAYLVSVAGTDRQTLVVVDVQLGRQLGPEIRDCWFTTVAWHPNSTGFCYNKSPSSESARTDEAVSQVFWHRVGTQSSEDILILDDSSREWLFQPFVPAGDHYFACIGSRGFDLRDRILLWPIDNFDAVEEIIPAGLAEFVTVGIVDKTLYGITDLAASRRRLVSLDIRSPQPEQWQTIVQESEDVIEDGVLVGGAICLRLLEHCAHRLKIVDLGGGELRTLRFAEPTTVKFSARPYLAGKLLFSAETFRAPSRVDSLDIFSGERTVFYKPAIAHTLEDCRIDQVFTPSRDGTAIPMFLIYCGELPRDGSGKVVMYGYGGFGISITPRFNLEILDWVRNHGVYAVANVRGGGEYGQAWHEMGRKRNRQNAIYDFQACAEWLIANGVTQSCRLGGRGGSNGGLLVTACAVHRPELFKAIVAISPITDLINLYKNAAGRYWVPEFGMPDDQEDLSFMRHLSPVHNVRAGRVYPKMLVIVGENDDRVPAWHGYKLVAALQEHGSKVYLKVNRRAGHRGGEARSLRLLEAIDVETFFAAALRE